MGHYANINENGIVETVIVAEQDFIETLDGLWIQTSYNTTGNVHTQGGTPLRYNFAGIGWYYDKQRDSFIPPKPYDSWILDENTCLWHAPTPRPDDNNKYRWDETEQQWKVNKILDDGRAEVAVIIH